MHIERELKFRLTPQSVGRLSLLAPRRRRVFSVYYDTPEQLLRRSGMALRLRRDGNMWLQTLKHDPAQHGALAARAEWEMPVRVNRLELGRFPRDEIRLATGVDLARVQRRLRPVFATSFTRCSGMVKLRRNGSAELAIDRGFISAGRRREPIREVELELKSGEPAALLRLAEQLGLPLGYESKAERGYRLAAGLSAEPRKWRMPVLDAAGPPGAAFAALASAALAQAGSNGAGMLVSSDPEYLHQMRVGLRRLRCALQIFAPILTGTKPVRDGLKRLMPALGTARDWDVLNQRMDHPKARRRREAARRAACGVASSPQFQAFLLRTLRWLQSEPWRESRLSPTAFAAEAMDRLHRDVSKSDFRSQGRRHKLRIRVKRLRYGCEFFAPYFAPASVEPYLDRLERLQDILGELNDLTVAGILLEEMHEPPESGFARRKRRLSGALAATWSAFARQPPYWRRRG